MTPYTKGAGYLLNGQNLNVSQREEADVRTCTHCQVVIKLQEWKKQGAWCSRCFAPICIPCGVKMQTRGCEPFLKRIEEASRRQMRFPQYEELARAAQPAELPQSIIVGVKG